MTSVDGGIPPDPSDAEATGASDDAPAAPAVPVVSREWSRQRRQAKGRRGQFDAPDAGPVPGAVTRMPAAPVGPGDPPAAAGAASAATGAAGPDVAPEPRGRARRPVFHASRAGMVVWVLATLLFIAGVGALGYEGYRTSLDVRGGTLLNVENNPAKPNYQAQVRPTPAHLIGQVGADGALGDLQIVVEGANGKGGVVVFIPSVTVLAGPSGTASNLEAIYKSGGFDKVVSSIEGAVGFGFTDSVLLKPDQVNAMFTPVGTVTFENPDTISATAAPGQRTIVYPAGQLQLPASKASDYLNRNGEGSSSFTRHQRGEALWEAWLKQVATAGDAGVPKIAAADTNGIDLGTTIGALASGTVSIQVLPLESVPLPTGVTVYRPDTAAIAALVPKIVPFPASAFLGQRPRVRILNGGPDRSTTLKAAPRVVEAGGTVTILGNASTFTVAKTRVEYHDPSKADAAAKVAAKFGVTATSSALQTEEFDVTVTLGADFTGVNAPTELAIAAARAADAKGATEISVLDVSAVVGICDLFVIVSARNTRLVGAVAEEIEEQLWLASDRKPTSVEGGDANRWVLLDYGDVVVHVFLDEERAFYRLDRLYGDATPVEWRAADEVGALPGTAAGAVAP